MLTKKWIILIGISFDKIIIVIILNIILSTPFLGTKFEKCEGDLDIRKTEDTNASFLTKQE